VLDFVRTFKATDQAFRSILRKTRIVFPLYIEEIQIVTRKSLGITDIVGLSGRVVAVGSPNSGTNLTTTFLFEVANVRPEVSVPIDATEAMEQLKAGKIDAFIYVSGAPTKLLLDQDASSDLTLVPVSNQAVADYYGFTTIKAGTYPWLDKDIVTPAVRAVLMTFEYDPNRNGYHKESCKAVSDITYLISRNIDYFRENGHPKWKQVDFKAVPPGWERSRCVEEGLAEDYRPEGLVSMTPTPELDADGNCSELLNSIALQLCKMKASRKS